MFRVRVRNFQSISDAEINIDGLTVITGPNNCGKTAFIRAFYGVFANPPATGLVRNGCAHLTVDVWFPSGDHVVWEKGWSEPNQKGGTVNRYTLNGKQLSSVGRGSPPEVLALGVRPLDGTSTTLWPQIATQFDGTLFLVNRPGAHTAEALSDVGVVGRLSDALKSSEADRRQLNAKLKIRRQDLAEVSSALARYHGLEDVTQEAERLKTQAEGFGATRTALAASRARLSRLEEAKAAADKLALFQEEAPSKDPLLRSARRLSECKKLSARLGEAFEATQRFDGFCEVAPPRPDLDLGQVERLSFLSRQQNHAAAQARRYANFCEVAPQIPDFPDTQQLFMFSQRLNAALAEAAAADEVYAAAVGRYEQAGKQLAEARAAASVCPTCGAIGGDC